MGRIAGNPNSKHYVWTPGERARSRLYYHACQLWLEAACDHDREYRRLLFEAVEAVCMVGDISPNDVAAACMKQQEIGA